VSRLPPFFALDGDRFVPSASARGPWSARHQHGGPPAASPAPAGRRDQRVAFGMLFTASSPIFLPIAEPTSVEVR
jgi:hypothetical protein